MRRQTCGWAKALVVAVASASAAAQIPAPPAAPVVKVTTPSTKPVRTTSTVSRTLRPAGAKPLSAAPNVGSMAGTVGKALPNGTTVSSPLLSAPLGTAKSLTTTVIKGQPGALGSAPVALARSPALAFGGLVSLQVPATSAGSATLLQYRSARISSLVRRNAQIELDPAENPIARGHVLLIDPDQTIVQRLESRGFHILSDDRDPWLAFRAVTLDTPAAMSTVAALRVVHSIAPATAADYDHIYQPAGGALGATAAPLAHGGGGGGLTIGMIDGGVAAHPALRGHILEQRGFAGAARSTAHGTAVASLIAGNGGRFHGAASGASLLVADVYGGRAGAGAASRIAEALSWLASRHPAVINISLVGPDNALLRRAIMAVRARGIPVVAAVGNDGPAAPPQYPASYAGVLSITGVDSRGVALFESGNATHLDFAAPGADMAAARPGSGFARVRGTSFAAPLAAGRLAVAGSVQRLASEARPGRGRVGRGIVCAACRVDPGSVGAN